MLRTPIKAPETHPLRALAPLTPVLAVLWLGACSSMQTDGPPRGYFNASDLADPVPVTEPVTARGNKSPYTVLGNTYRLLPTAAGYQAKGIASWYGRKFHGRLTSNGERFDMYALTAAHRSLPIPCYARITNLDNGKQTLVRVNDRGPFHPNRVIDLSYAAAVKLGFADHGTARVRIEVVAPSAPAQNDLYLQAGAFTGADAANALRNQLASVVDHPVVIMPAGGGDPYHRVQIGPLADDEELAALRALLGQNGVASAVARRRPSTPRALP